jgi:hypothetical protein
VILLPHLHTRLNMPPHWRSGHAITTLPEQSFRLHPVKFATSHAMRTAQANYLLHVILQQVLLPNEKEKKKTPRTVLPTLWLRWLREDGLGVFRNRVLTRIFGLMRDEITRGHKGQIMRRRMIHKGRTKQQKPQRIGHPAQLGGMISILWGRGDTWLHKSGQTCC